MTSDPLWLIEARKYLGVREIPGVNHNPLILRMWKAIKRGGIKDDETPWCAAFVGFCLENIGVQSSRFESAASYLKWGTSLAEPVRGCVAVFTRNGGGHVGFVTGVDNAGRLLVLGGNQGNEVNVRAFPRDRLALDGLRWPVGVALPEGPSLAVGAAPTTSGEA